MKKHIAVLLLMFIGSLALVSCSSDSDKPSKAEYRAGMKRALEASASQSAVPMQNEEKLLDCIVVESYDKLSVKALKFITTANFEKDLDKQIKSNDIDGEFKKVEGDLQQCYDKYNPYGLAPSKKSVPKTNLRSAITVVKSVQVGDGSEDYASITVDRLNQDEPDLKFEALPLDTTADSETVGVQVATPTQVILQTREPLLGLCFFVELNADSATRYGSSIVGPANECGLAPDPKTGSDYVTSQAVGWKTELDKDK